MIEKKHRVYIFKVKRTKNEPPITFRTIGIDSDEAIGRLCKQFQMELLEFHKVEPISVSKLMTMKEAALFTKEKVKEIRKMAKWDREKHIDLVPFPYLHQGLLRTMIQKLKKEGVKT